MGSQDKNPGSYKYDTTERATMPPHCALKSAKKSHVILLREVVGV